MKLLKLNIGDTLVFDHSDYTDYGIVYAVSENGQKAHAAFVDDGGGEDCLWLMEVQITKKGIETSEGGYDVTLDKDLLDRAKAGSDMEFRLVSLMKDAASTPDYVSLFLDDNMNKDDELSVLHDVIDTLRNGNEKFREVYDLMADDCEFNVIVSEKQKDAFAKDLKELVTKYNANCPALRKMMPVTERIKTFEDACMELGPIHKLCVEFNGIRQAMDAGVLSKDIVAYFKLRIIAAALNEGWEPQFTTDEYRWYPWFTLWTEEELKGKSEQWKKDRALWLFGGSSCNGADCGLASADSYNAWSYSNSYVSARLAVKSEELAVYFGKQFISIWADYVGPFNRKEAEK